MVKYFKGKMFILTKYSVYMINYTILAYVYKLLINVSERE